MKGSVSGRNKVLLISINFYEYINRIGDEIEKCLSATVDYLPLNYPASKFDSVLDKLTMRRFLKWKSMKNQHAFFDTHRDIVYDYILVIVGRGINVEAFTEFTKNQGKAKKILYLWDDVRRIEEFVRIREKFDVIFSFDKADCDNYFIRFLPLFYTQDYLYKGEPKEYDISFTGWLHSDRASVIDKIIGQLDEKKNYYIRVCATWFSLFKLRIKERAFFGKLPSYFSRTTLGMTENAIVAKTSKAVLDIPHPSQTGLSIRSIEALAAGAKLITTNSHIRDYDFYSAANICIIDRNAPRIPDDFLCASYKELPSNFLEDYSLETWVNTLFR